MEDYLSLVVFVVLVVGAAVTGGIWGADAWYAGLRKPSFTPPNWLFPPAWTILYILIALAGWFVWEAGGPGSELALAFWGAQLLFNGAWSYVFFGRRQLGLALADLSLMWLCILGFILAAWDVDRRASYMFMPYLVWVSYAGALNWRILRMNP
jgi:tryptophan-rich sensory protein